MNPNKSFFIVSSLLIGVLLILAYFYMGIERVEYDMIQVQKAGGIRDLTEDQGLNAAEMESLARFAVEEESKKVNCIMNFHRLVKAKEQVVAGKMYHLTVETTDEDGGISVYETKVWVKPWMNFKEVHEFNPSNDPSI